MDFVKKPSKRVLLTENDFRVLVGGGIVQQDGVEIALQDIGWDRMEECIKDAKGPDTLGVEEFRRIVSNLYGE